MHEAGRLGMTSPVYLWFSLGTYLSSGETGVKGSGLELEVEGESVVDEFLDVKRDLRSIHSAVIGVADFDRDVEEGVVVRVDVVRDGRGKQCRGVEEDFDLAEMLQKREGVCRHGRELLGGSKVRDGLAVSRFRADQSDGGILCACGGEREEREPAPIVDEVVVCNRVEDAIRAGPST